MQRLRDDDSLFSFNTKTFLVKQKKLRIKFYLLIDAPNDYIFTGKFHECLEDKEEVGSRDEREGGGRRRRKRRSKKKNEPDKKREMRKSFFF